MTSTYVPQTEGDASVCEDPMTRAELIALRNANSLMKDCHYVITDYTRATTLGNAQILLHAVDTNVLSQTALIDTIHDNTAWEGRYDIDTNRITELHDNVENIVVGENAVDDFPWGNDATVNQNYVNNSTINYTSGTFVGNRIEAGATVNLDGNNFTDNHVVGVNIITMSDTSVMTDNEIRGGSVVTVSGNVSFNRNTVKDSFTLTLINGTSDDNTFEGDGTYNQVGNGGTVNNSRIHGINTITSAVALNICDIFSTLLNSTGSTGLIQGATFKRSVVELQNIAVDIDIDDSSWHDSDYNANNAQEIIVRGSNFSGASDIDIGDGAVGRFFEVISKTSARINIAQGRGTITDSTIESEANLTFNSTVALPSENRVDESIIKNEATITFEGDCVDCSITTSTIENTADVRFQTGSNNASVQSSVVQEAQYLSSGNGDFRHGLISGAVIFRNFNVTCTNVISHVGTVTLTGASGSMSSCHFSRATINLTNVATVDVSELDMGSNSVIGAANALDVFINECDMDTGGTIDAETGTELSLSQCKISQDSILNVDNGRIVLQDSTVAETSSINVNNAGTNTGNELSVLSASSVTINGTGHVLNNVVIQNGSIVTFSTNSVDSTITNSTIDTESSAIFENGSDNCTIDSSNISNNGEVRFQSNAVNAQVIGSIISRYIYQVDGTGDISNSQLFGANTLSNENVNIDSLHVFRSGITLLGSTGTVSFSTWMRAQITLTNIADLDIDNLHLDSLVTINCNNSARIDITNCNFSTNSQVDTEAGTILDADDVTLMNAGLLNVDNGELRILRTSVSEGGAILQSTPGRNIVTDTIVNSNANIAFVNTVDDCRVEFSELGGNSQTNFRGTTVGATISYLKHFGQRTPGEVQIEDSDNALIQGATCFGSQLEIDNSPNCQILDCMAVNDSRISLRNNTAVVRAIRVTTENFATLNLINTAVAAAIINSKYMNDFDATFDFVVGGNVQTHLASGNITQVQTDPADGTFSQNF